jgi:hypothetical protein
MKRNVHIRKTHAHNVKLVSMKKVGGYRDKLTSGIKMIHHVVHNLLSFLVQSLNQQTQSHPAVLAAPCVQ